MAPFPTCIEEVTTAWLNQSLAGVSGGGTVTYFSGERIGEGIGLLGRLDRITLQWDEAPVDAPTSVVPKFATDNEEALGVVKIFNFNEKEVNFYSTLADQTLTRTPGCHAASYDGDGEQFVLLLEDVSTERMGGSPKIEALPWVNGLDHPL